MTRDDVIASCLLLTMVCCILLLGKSKFDKQGLADEMSELADQLRLLLPDGEPVTANEDPASV